MVGSEILRRSYNSVIQYMTLLHYMGIKLDNMLKFLRSQFRRIKNYNNATVPSLCI